MKRTLSLLLIASLLVTTVGPDLFYAHAGDAPVSGPSATDAAGAYGAAFTSRFSNPAAQDRYSARHGSEAPLTHFISLNFRNRKDAELAAPMFAALANKGIQPHDIAAMDDAALDAALSSAYQDASEATYAAADYYLKQSRQQPADESGLRDLNKMLGHVSDLGILYLDAEYHEQVLFAHEAVEKAVEKAERAHWSGRIEDPTRAWTKESRVDDVHPYIERGLAARKEAVSKQGQKSQVPNAFASTNRASPYFIPSKTSTKVRDIGRALILAAAGSVPLMVMGYGGVVAVAHVLSFNVWAAEAQAGTVMLYTALAGAASAFAGTVLTGVSDIMDRRDQRRSQEEKPARPSNGIRMDEVERDMQKARDLRAQMIASGVKTLFTMKTAIAAGIVGVVAAAAIPAFGAPAAIVSLVAAHPLLAPASLMFAVAATGWLYGLDLGREEVGKNEDILGIKYGMAAVGGTIGMMIGWALGVEALAMAANPAAVQIPGKFALFMLALTAVRMLWGLLALDRQKKR